MGAGGEGFGVWGLGSKLTAKLRTRGGGLRGGGGVWGFWGVVGFGWVWGFRELGLGGLGGFFWGGPTPGGVCPTLLE